MKGFIALFIFAADFSLVRCAHPHNSGLSFTPFVSNSLLNNSTEEPGTQFETERLLCNGHFCACSNGKHIQRSYLCDGDNDCGDHSDEQDAHCKNSTVQCRTDHMQCKESQKCIPNAFRCDFDFDCNRSGPTSSDEENCTYPICKEGAEFTCANKRCIPLSNVCDGADDCKDRFASDESLITTCYNRTERVNCSANQFPCATVNKCVSELHLCDVDNDCGDGSDEIPANCENRVCPENYFRCSNHKCISGMNLCDRVNNCPDRSDEEKEYCNDPNRTCIGTFFKCKGNGACVDPHLVCNGVNDCIDGFDELQDVCQSKICSEVEWKCKNGRCIGKKYICDADEDCSDNSDEDPDLCRNVTFVCSAGQTQCKERRQCIPNDHLCDFDFDCNPFGPTSSDEENCSYPICKVGEEFTCANKRCIPLHKACDGTKDCTDASDESLITVCFNHTAAHVTCSAHEFSCATVNFCVSNLHLCDGDNDCGDSSDELPANCEKRVCPNNYFRCLNHNCIPQEHLCDGDDDCSDGSDELQDNCNRPNQTCTGTFFKCKGTGCVEPHLVCDGTNHCKDGSDELQDVCNSKVCDEGQWKCKTGKCILNNRKCNEANDCGDNSDEDLELCANATVTCNADETLCKENNNCISKNLVCDFNFDCNRVGSTSSDEENCTYPVCKEGEELTFANKRCIPGGKANSSHSSSPNGGKELPEATNDGKAGVIFGALVGSLLIALGIIAAIFYKRKQKRHQLESDKSLILYNIKHDQVNSV